MAPIEGRRSSSTRLKLTARHQLFQVGLGVLMFLKGRPCPAEGVASAAQMFEALISTVR